MRFVVDGTTLCAPDGSRGAGIEHYTWSVVTRMCAMAPEHEWTLITPASLSSVRERELQEIGPQVRIARSSRVGGSMLSKHVVAPLRMMARRPDVLFAPHGQLPVAYKGKSVITAHDVAIFEHPEWFPQDQDFSTRVVVPRSFERASAILAVSQATANKLEALFPETHGKVEVVHEGVSVSEAYEVLKGMDQTSTRFPYDRDFILFIGTLEPRKNLVQAFRAFHKFLEARPEQAGQIRFVVAGKRGWQTKEIEAELLRVNHAWKEVEPHGVIQLLGAVTEQEKWTLLARASGLFYPSLDEGFGLPVLEAMAVGTAVITSNRGALPEVGGDAALYVEPDDLEAMTLALTQVLLVPEGIRGFMEQGIERVKQFSWEDTAKNTLKVLECVGSTRQE